MARPTLVLAGDGPAHNAEEHWLRPVLATWPGCARRPTPERLTLEGLLARLEATPSDTRVGERIYLIVGEPSRTGGTLSRVLDRLLGQTAPVVLISEQPRRVLRGADSRGLVVLPPDVGAAHLAWVLHALLARQPAMRSLAEDLRVVSLSGSGLAGEMNRLQDEMQLAAAIQRELLPTELPCVDGLDFGVLFRPAGYLSGDLYDLRETAPGVVSFCVADAMGHGVPAAMLTLLIAQHLARTACLMGSCDAPSPGQVLAGLNRAMADSNGEKARFATAVIGHIDRATGCVVLASAGHPPALRCSGAVREKLPDTGGPLLGVIPDAAYEDHELTLAPGETLLFYTDGFEMVFPESDSSLNLNKPTDAYLKHLPRIFGEAALHGEPLAEAAMRLARTMDHQAGSLHQVDDVTVLAVGRRAAAASHAA